MKVCGEGFNLWFIVVLDQLLHGTFILWASASIMTTKFVEKCIKINAKLNVSCCQPKFVG